MAFGLYIHVPYCLQKCHYCDFTTFNLDHEISMSQYTQLVISELRSRAKNITNKNLSSIYFGGGTPSLLPAADILAIRNEIANVGFNISQDVEITIEINPGTIDQQKLDLYLGTGINRFSVGVQTFNDEYLKKCGREHNAQASRDTLSLLTKNNQHYSFDLLFGLPNQTIDDLKKDLEELLLYSPKHVSLYNLTVPTHHHMNAFRASDIEQVQMFEVIDAALSRAGIIRYEISNFAVPGFESRHNQLYWTDAGYWGVGVSAHSYLPELGEFGSRFWNSSSYKEYISQIYDSLPEKQIENLKKHESLTDYCHTQLRMMRGLIYTQLIDKFGLTVQHLVTKRAEKLLERGMLLPTPEGFRLSPSALPLANSIFLEFTFLEGDI
jgi:oxygen-independent coproporphyrinogen III oxidase